MSGSLNIPFAIGETVWRAHLSYLEERVTCPECNGDKTLTLIKGNGERVILACGYCKVGYSPSYGTVALQRWEAVPTPFTCRRVDVRGTEFNYSEAEPDVGSYSYTSSANLFRDRDACAVRCAELNAEKADEVERRAIGALSSSRESLAHSAHYWTRKVADLRKDLARAEDMVKVSKAMKKAAKIAE